MEEALRLINGPTSASRGEDIEKLLSCPICLEVFTKPVVILPCQHNLCRKCANDVFERGTPMVSGGRFKCPSCRYEVVLDRHGVFGLQRNLLVENIIDMYHSECSKPLFTQSETLMCEDHAEEKVNIYCLTCQKPTCSMCKVFGEHQECTVSPMEKVYKEQKKEVSDAIAILVSGNDRLKAIITQMEDLAKITEANGRKAKNELTAAFDELYAVLEFRKKDMTSKIVEDVQERREALTAMLKNYGQQLEGAGKLIETSFALLEERNIPHFLTLSRNTIKQVLAAATASEVGKPPYDIQNMNEFEVNFESFEVFLKQLDFNPLEITLYQEENEKCNSLDLRPTNLEANASVVGNKSGYAENCDVNTQENSLDSSDIMPASLTSGSDPPPIIKKSRWYDMYVRQLPIPSPTTIVTSAPMESSVHMKVTIPDFNPDEEKKALETATERPSSPGEISSCDSEDVNREIEKLLARRRKRYISIYSNHSSPEESANTTPRSSPLFRRRYRTLLSESPVTRHTTALFNRRSDDSPNDWQADGSIQNREDSLLTRQVNKHCRLKNDLTTEPGSFSHLSLPSASESPASEQLTSHHYLLSDSSNGQTFQQQPVSDTQSTSNQSRRPRVYCTHKRRTWSHLLDKK